MAQFPSEAWVKLLEEKLNTDARYAQVAAKWEGDMAIVVEPDDTLNEPMFFYFDLWHGKCRASRQIADLSEVAPAFVLKAAYGNLKKVVLGELDPMQAMLTRKLDVKGNMAVMMRNVPTVLDFVRCAREITTETL